MHSTLTLRRQAQTGAASLAVALLLLFGMTLVAFFANKGFIFEQRSSINQYRSTRAFETAEAGLEWALARLNDPTEMAAAPSCATSTNVQSFRDRYIVPTGKVGATPAGFYPPANSRAACSISSAGVMSCTCPTPGTAPALGSSGDPRFMVQFNTVTGDPMAVEVVAFGCTNEDSQCDVSSTATGDARAVVRTVLKVVPTFPNAPAAALTTGAAAVSGGNLSVVNTDPGSNGITINSGTTVTQGTGTNVSTLAGTPPSASILDNDDSLNDLTNADTTGDLFFQSFFGKSMDAFKDSPQTKRLTSADCGSASACGALVSSLYDQGWQNFWVDPDISFTNANLPSIGTLGTADKPIFLAGAGNLELKSNLVAYGMLYAATATATENWDYSGSGSGTIFGALVSRGSFNKGSGTLNVVYDPNVFGKDGPPSGLMVRVPGSWRDRASSY